jgi:beta-lactamase class A
VEDVTAAPAARQYNSRRRRCGTAFFPCAALALGAVLAGACAAPRAADAPAAGGAAAGRLAAPVATTLAPLEAEIRGRIEHEDGEIAVALADLESGRWLGIDERVVMHAASTMKVPVLVELYRQAAARGLALDSPVPVRAAFTSIADGSVFTLTPADDSDDAIYAHVGATLPLSDLAHRMITRSSNLATNLLIERVTPDSVNAMLATIDATGMHVRRGVQDIPAFERGLNNTTTAEGLARTLAALAHCANLPRAYCDDAIAILEAQEFRDMIPAGLPAGARSASKSGWITGIRHDAAIVFRDGVPSFVLVVMTRGLPDTLAAQRVARDVAAAAWRALGDGGTLRAPRPAALDTVLRLHDRHRVGGVGTFTLVHEQLWRALLPVVDGAPHIGRDEVGRSVEGRPLHLLTVGGGPTRVLLWSQMHGDETTATRSLADLFAYIAADPDAARVQRWRERLTILAIPMLNPDGAERHVRRNAVGIDVNRDARSLATPEGRTLKAVRDRFEPHYGFNLHDQNPRTRVGTAERRAAISLLAPPPDAARTETEGVLRAKRLASIMGRFVEPMVGGHITRYDESFNPRAFGDLTQAWGTSAILVESGGWPGEHTKHHLRRTNFAMLVRALDAIADGGTEHGDAAWYAALPPNGRAMNDVLLLGGSVVLPGRLPVRADIVVDEDAPGAGWRVVEVGDLEGTSARDTLPLHGMFVRFEDAGAIGPGAMPAFSVVDAGDRIVWRYDGRLRRDRTSRAVRLAEPGADR